MNKKRFMGDSLRHVQRYFSASKTVNLIDENDDARLTTRVNWSQNVSILDFIGAKDHAIMEVLMTTSHIVSKPTPIFLHAGCSSRFPVSPNQQCQSTEVQIGNRTVVIKFCEVLHTTVIPVGVGSREAIDIDLLYKL